MSQPITSSSGDDAAEHQSITDYGVSTTSPLQQHQSTNEQLLRPAASGNIDDEQQQDEVGFSVPPPLPALLQQRRAVGQMMQREEGILPSSPSPPSPESPEGLPQESVDGDHQSSDDTLPQQPTPPNNSSSNTSTSSNHGALAKFVDNVQVGLGLTMWVLQLLCKSVVSSWVILIVYPICWVVYGVWRHEDDDKQQRRAAGEEGEDVDPANLQRREASPASDERSSGELTATALDNATGGGGLTVTRHTPSKGRSPMPSSSSFGQLDSFIATPNPNVSAAEMTRASRLRMTLNERLRNTGSQFCTEQPLNIHVATWNVANQPPPSNDGDACGLRRWLLGDELTDELERCAAASKENDGASSSVEPPPLSSFPDVVVVGLQEVEFGGIALMVETTESSVAWTEAVTDCLNDAVQWRVRYKKLRTVQLVGIVLIVVVRANHEPFVTHVRTSLARTGAISGVMGNKGSIGLRMTMYGKRFLFVCAHFHPHLNNATTRMKNYHNALSSLTFELSRDADDEFDVVRLYDEAFIRAATKNRQRDGVGSATTTRGSSRTEGQSAWSRFFAMRARRDDAVLKELRVLESHDYVFFFGDLNYRLHGLKGDQIRIDLPPVPSTSRSPSPSPSSSSSRRKLSSTATNLSLQCAQTKEDQELLRQWEAEHRDKIDEMVHKYDELSTGMYHRKIFNGFEESAITFPPTYKYDIGTSRYDSSSKKREPAWTDRILFRVWDEAHPVGDLISDDSDVASAAFHGHDPTDPQNDSMDSSSSMMPSISMLSRGGGGKPPRATSLPNPSLLRKVFSRSGPSMLLKSLGGTPIKQRPAAAAASVFDASSQDRLCDDTPPLMQLPRGDAAAAGGTSPHGRSSEGGGSRDQLLLSTSPWDEKATTTAAGAASSSPSLVQLLAASETEENDIEVDTSLFAVANNNKSNDGLKTSPCNPNVAAGASSSFTSASMLPPRAARHQRTLSGGSNGGGNSRVDGGGAGGMVGGNASASQFPSSLVAVKSAPFSNVVPNRLTACGYHSIPHLTLSDHKPVLAKFQLVVVGISEKQSQAAMSSCRDLWDSGHCDVDAHL